MKVLIVGAGPTGLTTALELARRGIDCDIVEKRPGPSQLSRAVGIMPESIRLLNFYGVGQDIAQEAMPFERTRLFDSRRQIGELDFTTTAEEVGTILGLAQDRTEALMANGLKRLGVAVSYAKEVVAVTQTENSDTVDVTFASGETATFDWVVGADGIHSVVRTQLGIEFPGYEIPGVWSIADVDIRRGL